MVGGWLMTDFQSVKLWYQSAGCFEISQAGAQQGAQAGSPNHITKAKAGWLMTNFLSDNLWSPSMRCSEITQAGSPNWVT